GAAQSFFVVEGIEIEEAEVETIHDFELAREREELFHRLALGAPRVAIPAGEGARPAADDDALIHRQQIREAHQPFGFERSAHPGDDDSILAAAAFDARELGDRWREDSGDLVSTFFDPGGVAIEDL